MSDKKKPVKVEVIDADRPQIVPVSQTHRVATAEGSALSAYEADLERRQEELHRIEDELLEDAMTVINGALKFADIPLDQQAPDGDFYEKHKDHPDPDKLFRIMKCAQMKSSEAPVGLAIAQKTAVGILKARAADKGKPQPLNVAIQVVTTMPTFERMKVE